MKFPRFAIVGLAALAVTGTGTAVAMASDESSKTAGPATVSAKAVPTAAVDSAGARAEVLADPNCVITVSYPYVTGNNKLRVDASSRCDQEISLHRIVITLKSSTGMGDRDEKVGGPFEFHFTQQTPSVSIEVDCDGVKDNFFWRSKANADWEYPQGAAGAMVESDHIADPC